MAKKELKIPVNKIELLGILNLPAKAKALVIFAHGSGSSRLSPRNQFVAEILEKEGLATLLFDLLTAQEDEIYENRFNIPLLAKRLKAVTQWVKQQNELKDFKIGYFGASTGSAAALIVAADLGQEIKAVVSRGGRPDLALNILDKVKAPTLLIVGGHDYDVITMNEQAYAKIKTVKELSIIPDATHLFEEPGALEKVAKQSANWFKKHL